MPPPSTAASGSSTMPPRLNPKPLSVSSSRPVTSDVPMSVTAAKPPAESSARPVLASTAVGLNPPPGSPTSRPSPATAMAVVITSALVRGRRPRACSAMATMTGVAPIVTRVARLTEESAIAPK